MLGDQILYFSEFFYYLLSHFENSDPTVAADFTVLCSHRWISDFQSGLINSKKIPKNVKFGLQADINILNKMNGSDRLFGFWKTENGVAALGPKCLWLHISHTLYIYIYMSKASV